jgi:hypothetical protein
MTQSYGKNTLDDDLEKIAQAREIVRKLMEFNLSQKQILNIIYFLSLNLENNEQMVEISTLVKSFEEKTLFTDYETIKEK